MGGGGNNEEEEEKEKDADVEAEQREEIVENDDDDDDDVRETDHCAPCNVFCPLLLKLINFNFIVRKLRSEKKSESERTRRCQTRSE